MIGTVGGCGDAEVSVVLVHGELVQNMARHSTRRLIADISTINTDPVHSSLFDLTPDRLSKIDLVKRDVDVTTRPDKKDLSCWSRVGLGYVDTNNRSEAVSYIGDVRMIDRRNPSSQRLPVYHIDRKQNWTRAVDWLRRHQVSIVSNQPRPRESSIHHQSSREHWTGMVRNVEDR